MDAYCRDAIFKEALASFGDSKIADDCETGGRKRVWYALKRV